MKTIIGPLDFSSTTQKQLDIIEQMALAFKSKVFLMHIENLSKEPADFSAGPDTVRKRAAREISDKCHEIHKKGEVLQAKGIDVTSLLIEGDIAETILDHAAKKDADMIIVGTHRKNIVSKALLGSISEKVLNGSSCPVLLIKP
ncbi:MAG: hypothetical protein GF401_02730 [Chitinivibrionales bacterium]|nr:hypothetical protein [Chitinivibrionales bacterium]